MLKSVLQRFTKFERKWHYYGLKRKFNFPHAIFKYPSKVQRKNIKLKRNINVAKSVKKFQYTPISNPEFSGSSVSRRPTADRGAGELWARDWVHTQTTSDMKMRLKSDLESTLFHVNNSLCPHRHMRGIIRAWQIRVNTCLTAVVMM